MRSLEFVNWRDRENVEGLNSGGEMFAGGGEGGAGRTNFKILVAEIRQGLRPPPQLKSEEYKEITYDRVSYFSACRVRGFKLCGHRKG